MGADALEEIVLQGRRFTLTIEGPDDTRRYSAFVTEVSTGRTLTRTPVRGRSPADARDRALEVMQNLLGIERLQEEFIAVAAALAPGAAVELTEDAHAVHAELTGAWELAVPFSIPRDEVADPTVDVESWRQGIRDHFRAYLRPAPR